MLTRHALRLVRRGGKIVLLGSRNRRNARIADECYEAGECRGVRGVELVLGRGQPRRRCEELGGFGRGVWKWCEEAAEECLHYLDDEMEVTLQLQAVGGEEGLEEFAEMRINGAGPG
jgi:hypothetical protein